MNELASERVDKLTSCLRRRRKSEKVKPKFSHRVHRETEDNISTEKPKGLRSKQRRRKTYIFSSDLMLSMSKTSNISYFNYLFNIYTFRCQADVVRLIHTTSSDHCSYNGNHFILDIIQCNHRLLSSFYKPLIILCNLWTSPYRG